MNNNKLELLIRGLCPVQNTVLKYSSHENSNLYLAYFRYHFFIRLLANVAQSSGLFRFSVAGVIELRSYEIVLMTLLLLAG
jgi:hypothetical protein